MPNVYGSSRWLVCCLVLALLCLLVPTPVGADGGAPNLAYVAGGANGISVIDIAQRKVTGAIPLAGDPQTVLLSQDGRFLYVNQPVFGRVAVLAARTGQTVCTASVPGHPTALALSPDATALYAAGDGGAGVRVLDPATCALRQTIPTSGPVYGLAVALIGAGSAVRPQLWVAETAALTIFNERGQAQERIPIPGGPHFLSLPGGYAAYVATRQGTVVAVDFATRQVHPLLAGGVFGPMDYDAITGKIYVPDRQHHQLVVLTPFSPGAQAAPREPSRVISLSGSPQSVAITSDGQLGLVALAGGRVAMLDIPGRQLVTTIEVGGTPHFIITGPYPPLVGTTPQEASWWRMILPFVGYGLVLLLCLLPLLLVWRHSRATLVRKGKESNADERKER